MVCAFVAGYTESTQTAQTVDVPVLNDVPVVVPTPPKIVAQNISNNAPMPKNVSDPINYTTLQYNKTNIDTVTEFFTLMPEYPGKGQYVSRSRYISFEARNHGLNISTVVVGGDGSAEHTEKHQVNTFISNGTRYYTSNLYTDDMRILTYNKLFILLNDTLPSGLTRLSPRDFWEP